MTLNATESLPYTHCCCIHIHHLCSRRIASVFLPSQADQKPSLADSALNTDVDGQPQRRSRRLASRSTSELESQASSGSSCSTEAMALGACSIDDRSPSSDSSSVSLSLSMAAPAASASAPAVLITPPKAPIDWSDNIFFSTYDSDLSVHNRESEVRGCTLVKQMCVRVCVCARCACFY